MDITGNGGFSNGFTSAPSNSPSIYWINTTSGGWTAFTDANATAGSNAYNRHQGIRIYCWGGINQVWNPGVPQAITVSLYGQVNTGAQSVVMHKGAYDNNQISNPYPSPVDIGTVLGAAYTGGKLAENAYYVWDPSLGATGQYVTKVPNGTPFYIRMGNSFQVRTLADGNTLDFTEANKSTTTSTMLRTFTEGVGLSVYDATYHPWDQLTVKFSSDASDKQEVLDASKLEGPADLNFYSVSSDNNKLSIDVRPFSADNAVQLGITSNVKSSFIFRADRFDIPEGATVYLHDKYLNKFKQLALGTEYAFSINEDPASQGDSRFELTADKTVRNTITSTKIALEASLAPNPATTEVEVSFTSVNNSATDIKVTNVSGETVFTRSLGNVTSGKITIPLTALASGVYIVTVNSGDARIDKTLIKQ
jgi:hypothetical protein